MVPNLLLECVKTQLYAARDSGLAQKALEDARQRFTIFHILNYIMYTEARNTLDVIEKHNLMRNTVKKRANQIEREWQKYYHLLQTNLKSEAWFLLQDFCMAAHDSIEELCTQMRFCFHNYLLKNKCRNSECVSQLSVALKIGDIIQTLWPEYFRTYKRICGLDFKDDFKYADLSRLIYLLNDLADVLSVGNPVVDFNKDFSCSMAMKALENKLASDNFQEVAARQAIEYSETYSPQYKQMLEDNEKQLAQGRDNEPSEQCSGGTRESKETRTA